MAKIKKIKSRQILDSRGNPTIETDVILEDGSLGRASVPSGASTGTHEALELRDGDPEHYQGLGVQKAVENVTEKIAEILIGQDARFQDELDRVMIGLDGTQNKRLLGANAILSVSLAIAKAEALSQGLPLFQYLAQLFGKKGGFKMPVPMFNILNGGKHSSFSLDIQEFMVVPQASSFKENLELGVKIFSALNSLIREKSLPITIGDEGGYALLNQNSNLVALDLINTAIEKSFFELPKKAAIALDVAASEFFDGNKYYLNVEKKILNREEMIDWLMGLVEKYHIISLEDALDEDDILGWQVLNAKLGNKILIVGDDLIATNSERLDTATANKAINATIIKPNQVGTLSETLEAIRHAKERGLKIVISHRSGETEDTFISHLAVGVDADYIKAGAPCRGERTAKYNELLRIEELLSEGFLSQP
jgi:enolase